MYTIREFNEGWVRDNFTLARRGVSLTEQYLVTKFAYFQKISTNNSVPKSHIRQIMR